jgi:hypothetical protein
MWYNRSEFKSMRRQNENIVADTNEEASDSDSEYCCRGLENLKEEQKNDRREKRLKGVLTVILEQKRQRIEESSCSPEMLSIRYENVSMQSEYAAQKRGLEDEREARAVYTTSLSTSDKPKPSRPTQKNQSQLRGRLFALKQLKANSQAVFTACGVQRSVK